MPHKLVARIGKAHALAGEVTVESFTDDPTGRFRPGHRFLSEAATGSGVPRELILRTARPHGGTWLLAFEGIPDRTGAEGLRGTRLFVDTSADPGPPVEASASSAASTDAWYDEDLVGLQVRDVESVVIGVVAAVEHGPAQDVLAITLSEGTTAYVPFVEALVPTVDPVSGYVVIDPPAGLLDLYR